MIHKHRGNRRYQTYIKAKRKADIVHSMGDYWYYPHFGMYRKGKIHCSCAMCAAKTNTRINKSNGPTDGSRRFQGRLAGTNRRLGKKNYNISEMRNVISMLDDIKEYKNNI